MDKKWITTFTVCGLLVASQMVFADDYETFFLNVTRDISKCIQDNCDSSGSSLNVSISLDSCLDVPGMYSMCSGTWRGSQSRDGYQFWSSITVTKTVAVSTTQTPRRPNARGSVQYQISAVVAPAWSLKTPQPTTMTLGQPGTIVDSVSFTGEEFAISNSNPPMSYRPILSLGPATISPGINLSH